MNRTQRVPCMTCEAEPGSPCTQPGRSEPLIGGYHPMRIELANKMIPHFPDDSELDETDKSLICYYSYIMLCDSVAANSLKLFNKEFTSEEIQVMFCKQAIVALKRDGLLSSQQESKPAEGLDS